MELEMDYLFICLSLAYNKRNFLSTFWFFKVEICHHFGHNFLVFRLKNCQYFGFSGQNIDFQFFRSQFFSFHVKNYQKIGFLGLKFVRILVFGFSDHNFSVFRLKIVNILVFQVKILVFIFSGHNFSVFMLKIIKNLVL